MGLLPELYWNIKANGKGTQNRVGSELKKKKKEKKTHHRMDLILKRQNLGNKKAVIEIYFTNVIKICLKDRFQFCKGMKSRKCLLLCCRGKKISNRWHQKHRLQFYSFIYYILLKKITYIYISIHLREFS